MIYYLCGPIDTAGQTEKNINEFKRAAIYLRTFGYEVISPIESVPHANNYLDYIKKDIREMLECDAIILLPGWPQSKGAKGELAIAMHLDMKVYFFNIDAVEKLINMNF